MPSRKKSTLQKYSIYFKKGYLSQYDDKIMQFFKEDNNIYLACKILLTAQNMPLDSLFGATDLINFYIKQLCDRGVLEFSDSLSRKHNRGNYQSLSEATESLYGKLRPLLRRPTSENESKIIPVLLGKVSIKNTSTFKLGDLTPIKNLSEVLDEQLSKLISTIEGTFGNPPKIKYSYRNIKKLLLSSWDQKQAEKVKVEGFEPIKNNLLFLYRVYNTQSTFLKKNNQYTNDNIQQNLEEVVIGKQIESLDPTKEASATDIDAIFNLIMAQDKLVEKINENTKNNNSEHRSKKQKVS